MIKVLSLWQPWASLAAWGFKRYETRHWSTDYRGTVLIHAMQRLEREFFYDERVHQLLSGVGYKTHQDLPTGAALALVDIKDVYSTDTIKFFISDDECHFGNFNSGRYAFEFWKLRRLPEPITLKGKQSVLWGLPELPLWPEIWEHYS